MPDKGKYNGLIRFDSMQISVFPFRAVVADSTYLLECQRLEIHSYPANISAKGLTLIPLNAKGIEPNQHKLLSLSIPELKLNGFYFDKAIFEKTWMLDRIEVKNPSVIIALNPGGKPEIP